MALLKRSLPPCTKASGTPPPSSCGEGPSLIPPQFDFSLRSLMEHRLSDPLGTWAVSSLATLDLVAESSGLSS